MFQVFLIHPEELTSKRNDNTIYESPQLAQNTLSKFLFWASMSFNNLLKSLFQITAGNHQDGSKWLVANFGAC